MERLETLTSQADFWLDPVNAQATMRRITELKEDVSLWDKLTRQVSDLRELAGLATTDETALLSEIERETTALEKSLGKLEFQLMLGGEYDSRNSYLAIHAGAGGTESQDWAAMLLRMYLRWAETRGFETTILDQTEGEEAGLKSVTVEVKGRYAYGYLKAERGVHRLVRLSPFDAAHRRHTSFAKVEVMPVIDETVSVNINPEDLKIDVFRSSGAGGQNVQKTSTAVRITHLPTGIVVTCQNERSQLQNKETALNVLRSRLLEIELEKKEEEEARLKGENVSAGWGNQIRSYVLHPYNMVKDHRTNFETSNTTAVLDGAIDDFIEAYLKSKVGVLP